MSASVAASGHQSSERTALTGVVVGFVDTGITVGAMIAASSAVLLADSLKTLLEFIAVLLSYIAIRRIHRGGGNRFEYGLDKLENLSSLFVAILMFVCLAVIVVNATINVLHPSHISGPGIWVSMGAQVVYFVFNSLLFRKNRMLARSEGSPVMQSQARLFLTKAIANVFILLSLVSSLLLVQYGWSQFIDPIASLVIAVSILVPAIGIFSSSFYDLLDRTAEESHKIIILRELSPYVCDVGLHEIRTRRSGRMVFIDITVEFDPELQVRDACEMVEKLRYAIEQAVPHSHVCIGLTDPAFKAALEQNEQPKLILPA